MELSVHAYPDFIQNEYTEPFYLLEHIHCTSIYEKALLKTMIYLSDGVVAMLDSNSITWISSFPGIATVEDFIVQAHVNIFWNHSFMTLSLSRIRETKPFDMVD